jgi:hypothetical protein
MCCGYIVSIIDFIIITDKMDSYTLQAQNLMSAPFVFDCPMALVKAHTSSDIDPMNYILYFSQQGFRFADPELQSAELTSQLEMLNSAMKERFEASFSVSMLPSYKLHKKDDHFDGPVEIPDLLSILEPYSQSLAENELVHGDCKVALSVLIDQCKHPKIGLEIQAQGWGPGKERSLTFFVHNTFDKEYALFNKNGTSLDPLKRFYAGSFGGRMEMHWSHSLKRFV